MSLIQEALKKAQKERDKGQESHQPAADDRAYEDEYQPGPEGRGTTIFTGKRLVVYSLLFLVVIISLVAVTFLFKPDSESRMKIPPRMAPEKPVTTQVNKTQPPRAPAAQPPQIIKKDEPLKTSPAQTRKPPVKKIKETKPKIKARERPAPKRKKTEKESVLEELLTAGDQLMARGNVVLAVDRYRKALEIEKRVSLYLKLYSAFRAMKNNVLARAYIDEGLKQFPDSFALNKVSAILHIRAREFDKALQKIDTALTRNNGDYAVFTYKGLCHFHKKEYEKALLSFKQSLDINVDAVENYYYIALIYDNVKDYKKALEFYRVFFQLNPEGKHFKHRDWVIKRIKELERYIKQ